MVAINVIGASDKQLQMLVNKANMEGYNMWNSGREFTIKSIKDNNDCEVIYLEDSKNIVYSPLYYAETHNIYSKILITIQEYIYE